MLNEKVAYYVEKIKNSEFTRLSNIAENILLRPNDNIAFIGKEKFEALVKAFEIVLEDHKDDEIYKYYYELPKVKHGFCTFGRWKNGMLF